MAQTKIVMAQTEIIMAHEGKVKYLFEYQYAGSAWIGEVWADNWEDAESKIRAIGRGTVSGPAVAQIKVPHWLYVMWQRLRGRHDA